MGTTVLPVEGNRTGTSRVYAHRDPATNTVGVVVLNLASESQAVDLAIGNSTDATGAEQGPAGFLEYALTSYPVAADMESAMTALNTKQLELDSGTGALPDLVGVARAGSTVIAQGRSVTFVEFQL